MVSKYEPATTQLPAPAQLTDSRPATGGLYASAGRGAASVEVQVPPESVSNPDVPSLTRQLPAPAQLAENSETKPPGFAGRGALVGLQVSLGAVVVGVEPLSTTRTIEPFGFLKAAVSSEPTTDEAMRFASCWTNFENCSQ